MYSYQHKYHAGNFADLHKHLTLIAILKYLQKKPAAFCAIDLFAGDGIYDLTCLEAQRNREFQTGYSLLAQLAEQQQLLCTDPDLTTRNLINQSLANQNLFADLLSMSSKNIYPGSPAIISHLLRTQDSGIFIENHPQSFQVLANNFQSSPNIKTYKKNAYEAINSFVPYTETRGLVLIDPSYEVKTEYQDILDLVKKTHARKATGITIIWYPILASHNLYKKLYSLVDNFNHNSTNTWHHQLILQPKENNKDQIDHFGMIGSGIIVINIPWTVDKILEQHFDLVKNLI